MVVVFQLMPNRQNSDGAGIINFVQRKLERARARAWGVVPQGSSVPPKRLPAHYPWAVLIARIYEVFPLPGN